MIDMQTIIKIDDDQFNKIIAAYLTRGIVEKGDMTKREIIETYKELCGDGRFDADVDERLRATEASIAAMKENGLPIDQVDMYLKKSDFKWSYDPLTRSWINNEERR